jgi:hypothetical protein
MSDRSTTIEQDDDNNDTPSANSASTQGHNDMTDNVAILDGYTQEYLASCDTMDLLILAKPDTDFDLPSVRVWDCDGQEYIYIKPHLFDLDLLDDHRVAA